MIHGASMYRAAVSAVSGGRLRGSERDRARPRRRRLQRGRIARRASESARRPTPAAALPARVLRSPPPTPDPFPSMSFETYTARTPARSSARRRRRSPRARAYADFFGPDCRTPSVDSQCSFGLPDARTPTWTKPHRAEKLVRVESHVRSRCERPSLVSSRSVCASGCRCRTSDPALNERLSPPVARE